MAGGWYTTGIDPSLLDLVPNDGPVFDAGSWDGFMQVREQLFDTIATYNIDNCMIVSGDAHITMAMDLVKHPHDTIEYDPVTGNGSVGTEFLPASITRGNFDEQGVPASFSDFLMGLSLGANPHHRLMEINSHGYGIVTITPDSITATPYYSDILQVTPTETAGQQMVMLNGENRWKRSVNTGLSSLLDQSILSVRPNPTDDALTVVINQTDAHAFTGFLYDASGLVVAQFTVAGQYTLNTASLSNGVYRLVLTDKNGQLKATRSVLVLH